MQFVGGLYVQERMEVAVSTMSGVEEEILINEIRSHPIIYNKFLPGYKKIFHREEEWKKIANTLNIGMYYIELLINLYFFYDII